MISGMTAKQFSDAVTKIRKTRCDERMLRVMGRLGNTAVDTRRYARAMNWKSNVGAAAHRNFGRLCRRLCKKSGYALPRSATCWVESIFDFPGEPKILWRVKPHIYRALRKYIRVR
jgi:hypothetical protein